MSRDPNPSSSLDYYAARAVEERRLAMASADPKVRAVHLELAEKYNQLVEFSGQDPMQVTGGKQRTA